MKESGREQRNVGTCSVCIQGQQREQILGLELVWRAAEGGCGRLPGEGSLPAPRTNPTGTGRVGPLSPRLCRRTSRASSVANSVLGKRMKILVLRGQQ